jgi:acyl-CoA synthetase (AMP-forming)/AMP-acid ligase II
MSNPDLQDALRQLEQEFEEGDITRKGYEKRRTLILSQYGAPPRAPQRGLRLHNPDDSDHPVAADGSRSASLATFPASSSLSSSTLVSPNPPSMVRQITAVKDDSGGQGSMRSSSPGGLVQRFHERETGGVRPQKSFDNRRDTLTIDSSAGSRSQTLMSQNYAFNPESQGEVYGNGGDTRHSTMLDSQQGYFSDFAGQQRQDTQEEYGGRRQRYSQGELTSPTAQIPPPFLSSGELHGGASIHQMPLEPRDTPFAICDPHDSNIEMSKFENIAMVLRHRAKTNGGQAAYWVLDQKGKETVSITWAKLASRAEKVAQVIKDKSSLYRGDRVALIYTENEIIEFAVALMGCFIAGVVAVPINDLKNYARLNVILTSTQAHLALTTEANLKNFQRDITAAKLNWPRGVEWWKTNEFGSYHPKKKGEEQELIVPVLAYVEFSTAPTGDLRGVVLSHKTVMHQMATLSAVVCSATSNTEGDTFNPNLRDKEGHVVTGNPFGETILSYLDPRQSIGMILGVLLNVYGGHTCIWLDHRTIDTPGLYAHLITKYKSTLMVADYPGLKRAAYNYQADPMTTRNYKKGIEPNFRYVKLCLIDTLTVDAEFHELLADRWLKPLRNPRAREIVAPMLCLPEHGGMVISMRDWLGGEDRMGCSLTHEMDHSDTEEEHRDQTTPKTGFGSSLLGGGNKVNRKSAEKSTEDLGEVLLDKEALKTNDVVIIAMGSEARAKASAYPNAIRCGAFGYPIPDATLAVVDPESGLLCSPNSVGEIWVDSPSLSGGFWALPKHTESIFHARPFCFKEGNPTPTAIDPEFLRTGLLGCVIEGKVYVLGLYEDRLRQRVEWVERGLAVQEHRYFFVQHLIFSIMRNVPKIHDCSAFDCFVNDEHLPIVLLESASASTAPITSGGPPRQLDIPLLDSLSERTMEVLYQEHHLRVYCVLITAPGVLPRVTKNGRREIGNMLCRREFDNGSLPCVHVKFGVERAVQNLPVGEDIQGGIWSSVSSDARDNILYEQEKQYSGVDYREVVIDDRTSTSLSNFNNIFDLMQWRVMRQGDELAYCTIDGRGKEGKGLTWKKFDTRVAAVAMYLRNKVKIKSSDHVILMYTHSEDYVFAIYACMVLGAIAIPVAPLDANRLSEDAPAYLHIVADMGVRVVLCNSDVDHLFKQKIVSQHLKQSAQFLKTHIPTVYNTAKPPKQSHGCRDLGLTMNKTWITPTNPIIIWTYWTPDQRRQSIQLGHDTILGMCKVQKETCQMTSSKPVLGCVRSSMGLGFIHTCLMGVYNGSPTYLISPLDFAQNPTSLFTALSRYKVKDTYATGQMLDFAMSHMQGKGFSLHELKNLMISTEGRPRQDIFTKVRLHFGPTGLDRTAINTIYSHVLNPMIASRSYMSIEPIELWLDVRALRRGLVFPVDPDTDPTALCIQDSGMVPVSTQIAIVNPETCQLCHIGEYGEIWVQSEACAKSFYMSRQAFDEERFNGRIMGGDPNAAYVRTGDLGFLHNVTRPIGANNQPVEMQILFVLGSVGETFEVNGLNHFPLDIETSVEKSHRNITPGGCAVFQAGGMVVVIVEVFRKAYLASIVPVIVNAVLNEHQIVVDIVAFVGNGDFPRSRLSEKQRGKILASWVTRKLRTIAQFGIRDPDGPDHRLTEVPEPRSRQSVSVGSKRGMHDPTRSSIVSESPAHMQPPQQNGGDRSSYMPDLGLPPNHYQIDPSGLYEEQQSAPVVSLNDRPYIAELPDQSYRDHSPDGSENFDDDEFFDPNAQNFGNYTPQSSNPDLPGPPRLSLVNPDLYSLNGSDNNSTNTSTIGPQSGTATVISPMASRPHPLSAGASSGRRGSWDMGESPYEDQGNPFANSIPASVPSFDFINPSPAVPRSKSPIPTRKPIGSGDSRPNSRPTSPGPGSGLIAAVTASAPPGPAPPIPPKGRALLPSQQARYNQTPTALRNVEDAEMNQGRFPQHQDWDHSSSADHQDADSKLHPDRPGTALSQYSTITDGADLRSQAGSVRRRYDGSGYEDGW